MNTRPLTATSGDGDVLVILDADLTVMPEELPYFIEAITRGRAELSRNRASSIRFRNCHARGEYGGK